MEKNNILELLKLKGLDETILETKIQSRLVPREFMTDIRQYVDLKMIRAGEYSIKDILEIADKNNNENLFLMVFTYININI